jgi:hypothetical protein
MSNIVNKVKEAVTGHKHTEHTDTTNTGTHSNTTADPVFYSSNTTAGPHNSNIANKVDPRVDSDRDGSRTVGGNTYGTGTTGMGTTGYDTTNTGMTGTTGGHGPHNSKMANKIDPRVDSTTGMMNTGSGTTGMGTTGMGTTGSGFTHSTNAGPHNSSMANKMDPRVDSDRDGSYTVGGNNTYGSGATGYGTTGTGMTGSTHNKTTVGPHKSDMANKLDPRVDSDLDGSKTIGGPKY